MTTKNYKNPIFSLYDLVVIEWVDSYAARAEWDYLEGLDPLVPAKCVSTGFLLEDTKDYKCLAQSMTRKQVVGRMSIPTGCILNIVVLHSRPREKREK